MPDGRLSRRVIVCCIHVGVTVVAQTLEPARKEVSVTVQQVCAKLVDNYQNDERGTIQRRRERLGRWRGSAGEAGNCSSKSDSTQGFVKIHSVVCSEC